MKSLKLFSKLSIAALALAAMSFSVSGCSDAGEFEEPASVEVLEVSEEEYQEATAEVFEAMGKADAALATMVLVPTNGGMFVTAARAAAWGFRIARLATPIGLASIAAEMVITHAVETYIANKKLNADGSKAKDKAVTKAKAEKAAAESAAKRCESRIRGNGKAQCAKPQSCNHSQTCAEIAARLAAAEACLLFRNSQKNCWAQYDRTYRGGEEPGHKQQRLNAQANASQCRSVEASHQPRC